MRGLGFVTAAVAVAVFAGDANASPLELYGFGGRSPALAGGGVASTVGYDAVYLNPAGLAEIRRKRFTAGYTFGNIDLHLNAGGPGQEKSVNSSDPYATVFGGAVPLPLGGKLRDRVVLGLGLHIPTGSLVRVNVPLPGEPSFALLQTRSNVIGIQGALGVRINEHWQVGAGFLALAALRGSIFVDVDGAGRFTSLAEQRLITDFAPILGVRYLPTNDRLRFGLTLRGASRSDYDIEVTNDLASSLPLSIPALRIAGTAQYDPLIVAAEGAWQVARFVQLGLQLDYQRWSHFPPPTENPLESQPKVEDPGFHDNVVPRLSAEVLVPGRIDAYGRAGIAFVRSPAPEMTGRQSLLDNDRIIWAAGGGLYARRWSVPLYLDFWFQLHDLLARRHTKDLDQFDPGDRVPFATIVADGYIFAGGVTLGVDL